jgi:hypothetical protein
MNDTLIETIQYRGSEISIHHDPDAESPQQWDDSICFLVYDHRDFTVQEDGYDPQELFDDYWSQEIDRTEEYWLFPVYALIHSGTWLSLGRSFGRCDPGGWDTSFRGFALRKRKRGLIKRYAKRDVQYLIDDWNKYLSGECCGYMIDDGDGDSCWGYYDKKYAIQDAKAIIDGMISESNEPLIPITS